MKKVVLTVFIILSVCVAVPCFAQDYTDVPEDSEYYEAILRLSRLSIIAGYPDGSFGVDENITRAEVAVLAVRLSGNSNNVTHTESVFKDVTDDYWAADIIMFCKQSGIMNGVGENRFAPDSCITDEELLTLLVRLCGVDDKNYKYPDSYIHQANLREITRDYNYKIGHVTTRGEAAILLRNSLDAPITEDNITYNGYGGTEYKTLYNTIFGGIYPVGMNFASSAGVKNGSIGINYNTINVYMLNGIKYIFAESLQNQGFDVINDNENNVIYINRNLKKIPDCMIGFKRRIGEYENQWNADKYNLYDNKTKVYMDGRLVESYGVIGGNLICVDEMYNYGTSEDGYKFDILIPNMVVYDENAAMSSTIYKFPNDPSNHVTVSFYSDGFYNTRVTVKNYDENDGKYYGCMYHIYDRRMPYNEYKDFESGEYDENDKLKNGVYSTYNKVSIIRGVYLVRDYEVSDNLYDPN